MEKLSINNFAGLKEVSLEISPVTGLIGPQASGKSVSAKLLFFFREIASRLPEAVVGDDMNAAQYKAECCKRFNRYFPVDQTRIPDFSITYSSKGEQVRVTFRKEESEEQGTIGLEWSDFYPKAIETLAERKKKLLGSVVESEKEAITKVQRALRDEFDKEASEILGPWSKYEQIFIPSGRAFFSQVKATVFTRLASGDEPPDPFMSEFGSLLERSKNVLESRGFFGSQEKMSASDTVRNERLRGAFKEILHADLLRLEKQDLLQYDDGRRVKLAQASSGQQEALPLLVLLARFISLHHARGRAVYIEEPEAHLFPLTQKQIVEFMARAFRTRKGEMCLVITTHSPYILTSINNLLQAGMLYAQTKQEEVQRLAQIVPRSQSFNVGEVGFYALKDGGANSIMDHETGLIDGAVIDQVSNDIAIQFDKLLAEGNEKS